MSEMTESETRMSPRKQFHCRAKVVVGDRPPLTAETVDISQSGIGVILSVMVHEPIESGISCVVAFEVPVEDGTMQQVTAVARTVYSISSGPAGFRIGLQFVQMDAANTTIINELVG